MVTVEDIVEEIFGEIEDEHDVEALVEEKISEYEYRFSAKLEIDQINQSYGLELPESEDYETLAGFIIEHHQSIPDEKQKILIGNFLFTITKMESTRIEEVILRVQD